MTDLDTFRLSELTVRDQEGNAVVRDNNGDILVTFQGVEGLYGESPVFDAFVEGLIAKFGNISIWNDNKAEYVVSSGSVYLRNEGRYADEPEGFKGPRP